MILIFVASLLLGLGTLKIIYAPEMEWIRYLRTLHKRPRSITFALLPAAFISAFLVNVAIYSLMLSISDENTSEISIALIAIAYTALLTVGSWRIRK